MSREKNENHESRALYKPIFPQNPENGGAITESDLKQDNFIFIEIQNYSESERGDEIRLYFADLPPIFKLITDSEKDFPVIYKIPAESLKDGAYSAYYSVTRISGNINNSQASSAIISRYKR